MEAAPLKSADELAADLRGDNAEDQDEQKEDPKARDTYTFDFEAVESGSGKTRKGKFTNHIMNAGMIRRRGVLQAQLSGGVPWSALAPVDQELISTQAHLAISLDPKKRPKWAKNMDALVGLGVIFKLYDEVASHEATFHGSEEDQDEGEGDSSPEDPDGGTSDLAPGKASAV